MGSTLFTKKDLPLWLQMQSGREQAEEQHYQDYFQRQKDISGAVEDPDMFSDIDAYLNILAPILGLTKGAFIKSASKLLAPGEKAEYLGRVAKDIVKSIDEVIPYAKETIPAYWYGKGVRGSMQTKGLTRAFDTPYTNRSADKSIMAIKGGTDIRTPLHEAGHQLLSMVSPGDKKLINNVWKSIDKEDLKTMEQGLDVSLHKGEELFAEAYAQYLSGSEAFGLFHPFIKHLVKKYHKLNR